MLVLPARLLAVLVIGYKSVPICNHFHATLVDNR